MKKCLIFLLCGLMLLSMTACGGEEEQGSIPHEEGEVYVSYANDPTADMFIQAFMKVADYQPHDIHSGDREGEVIFIVDQTTVTLVPQDTGMYVYIDGGTTDDQLAMALTTFSWCVKAIDPAASDITIKNCLDRMKSSESSFGNVWITMYTKLAAYLPAVKMDTVQTNARIELWAHQYKADENATRTPATTTTAAAK